MGSLHTIHLFNQLVNHRLDVMEQSISFMEKDLPEMLHRALIVNPLSPFTTLKGLCLSHRHCTSYPSLLNIKLKQGHLSMPDKQLKVVTEKGQHGTSSSALCDLNSCVVCAELAAALGKQLHFYTPLCYSRKINCRAYKAYNLS